MYVQAKEALDEGTDVDASITVIQFGTTLWVKGKVLRSTEKGMAIGFLGTVPREIESILNSNWK